MSILYDYLSVLEKKKSKDSKDFKESKESAVAVAPQVAVQQKTKSALPSSFLIGVLVLVSAVFLFTVFENIKNSLPKAAEKAKVSREIRKAPVEEPSSSVVDRPSLDYSLKGIIYNTDSPTAIIDGKLVGKGGRVGDWMVVEILPAEVHLENLKNSSLLTLKIDSVLE